MLIEGFSTQNKLIAVRRLENVGTKTVVSGGFARIEAKVQAVETIALADAYLGDGEVILAGSKIVFLGEAMVSSWNQQPLEFKGIQFVLAPTEQIIMVAPPESSEPK